MVPQDGGGSWWKGLSPGGTGVGELMGQGAHHGVLNQGLSWGSPQGRGGLSLIQGRCQGMGGLFQGRGVLQ